MASRHFILFYTLKLAVLIVALGVAACAGPPGSPGEGRGGGRVETIAGTPDPACVAKCERHFKEAVRVCDDLYNTPDSDHYRDDAWRQKCLEQARMQYESCLSLCGK